MRIQPLAQNHVELILEDGSVIDVNDGTFERPGAGGRVIGNLSIRILSSPMPKKIRIGEDSAGVTIENIKFPVKDKGRGG